MTKEDSNHCNITVLDKDYAISCKEEERVMLMKSAEFLNEKIKETRTSGNISGGERIVVMTALNIVYEFLLAQESQQDNHQLNKKLAKMNKKIETALRSTQQIELTQ